MHAYNLSGPAAFAPLAAQNGLSVLVIADRLLTLAQQAERAGLAVTASQLVQMAHDVFDEQAAAAH